MNSNHFIITLLISIITSALVTGVVFFLLNEQNKPTSLSIEHVAQQRTQTPEIISIQNKTDEQATNTLEKESTPKTDTAAKNTLVEKTNVTVYEDKHLPFKITYNPDTYVLSEKIENQTSFNKNSYAYKIFTLSPKDSSSFTIKIDANLPPTSDNTIGFRYVFQDPQNLNFKIIDKGPQQQVGSEINGLLSKNNIHYYIRITKQSPFTLEDIKNIEAMMFSARF